MTPLQFNLVSLLLNFAIHPITLLLKRADILTYQRVLMGGYLCTCIYDDATQVLYELVLYCNVFYIFQAPVSVDEECTDTPPLESTMRSDIDR